MANILIDPDAILGKMQGAYYAHHRQRDCDYTLLCVDDKTQSVLWRDEQSGGLVYRTFDNDDFMHMTSYEFGIRERTRDIERLLGLEDN